MAESDALLTSEEMARRMDTNAVVIRRTMSGLRKSGIVTSRKGHGGGWSLARSLHEVTLIDVYEALGMPTVFAMGNRTESPGCVVEQAVNHAMADAFDAAEALFVARLREVTLADVAKDAQHRMAPRRHKSKKRKAAKHV